MKSRILGAIFGATLGAASLVSATRAAAQTHFWDLWQVWHGNDTGGLIPWSCENEATAHQVAGAFCAQFGKYARITAVTRHYGDYISFNCLWSPNIGRYDLPAAATRASCPGGPRPLITK